MDFFFTDTEIRKIYDFFFQSPLNYIIWTQWRSCGRGW